MYDLTDKVMTLEKRRRGQYRGVIYRGLTIYAQRLLELIRVKREVSVRRNIASMGDSQLPSHHAPPVKSTTLVSDMIRWTRVREVDKVLLSITV